MTDRSMPLSEADKARYSELNRENLAFLMDRYNDVNRWVIADMIRRTAYHHPDKDAMIFNGRTLTYSQMEAECNRTANALRELGVEKYDRVAILAQAVTALVVPEQGETVTEEEITQLCRRELANFKCPKGVIFLMALPKTPTGKILKREMRFTYKDLYRS